LQDAGAHSTRDGEMSEAGIGRSLAKTTKVSIRKDKTIAETSDISSVTSKYTKHSTYKEGNTPVVVEFTPEELKYAEELPLWVHFPSSLEEWLSVPHPSDLINVRIKGALVLAQICLSLLLDAILDIPWLYIYITVAYFLRCAIGPKLDPTSWLTVFLIRPIIDKLFHPKPGYTAGPPKRFAQFCGGFMALLYTLIRMAGGHKEPANYVAGLHCMLIILEFYFSLCAGCGMFACMMLVGIIPEGTCEQCRIMFAAEEEDLDFLDPNDVRSTMVSQTGEV